MKTTVSLILITLFAAGCATQTPESVNFELSQAFKDYWYNGKGEISSYHLEQARYGEIHPGEAVLIFVTEDFSKSKHVKLDNPAANRNDALSILKLNMTKKFFTGIYPYSIMMSSFKPVEIKKFPDVLKVSMTSQEWCGHTFYQLNRTKNGFEGQLRSYFEQEGDVQFKLDDTDLVEDEVWQIIRLDPQLLPLGNISIVPGSIHTRLRHAPSASQRATTTLISDNRNPKHKIYKIEYEDLDRELSITFQSTFPHQILGWTETVKSGFGQNAKELITKATLKKTIQLDYWSHHDLQDSTWKKELMLISN